MFTNHDWHKLDVLSKQSFQNFQAITSNIMPTKSLGEMFLFEDKATQAYPMV